MAQVKVWECHGNENVYVGSFSVDEVWSEDVVQGDVERKARSLAGSTGKLILGCNDQLWNYPSLTSLEAAIAERKAEFWAVVDGENNGERTNANFEQLEQILQDLRDRYA
tara:strand:- start:818 stop:1147 length:330 start_codon:yes stop_codon:yes gene_type:complete